MSDHSDKVCSVFLYHILPAFPVSVCLDRSFHHPDHSTLGPINVGVGGLIGGIISTGLCLPCEQVPQVIKTLIPLLFTVPKCVYVLISLVKNKLSKLFCDSEVFYLVIC